MDLRHFLYYLAHPRNLIVGIAPSEETEPKPNPASLPPTATVTKDETSFSTYDPPADTIAESEAKDDEKL